MRIDEVEDHLFEMSNFRKNETGLPTNIYVSTGIRLENKLPRMKVQLTQADHFDSQSTVSIFIKKDVTADDIIGYARMSSRTLSKIREFMNLNYDTLIDYWNSEISTTELTRRIKKINQ
jgi:hypothetical protein